MAATAQLQTYDRANLQQQAFDSLLSDHYYYYYKNRTPVSYTHLTLPTNREV